jgi:hypothetical protein
MTKLSADAPPGEVAVHPTVVSPTANVDPDAGEQTTVASELEVAVNVTAAPFEAVASAVMSFGTMSIGAVGPPVTVTRKVPVALFACESVAVQLTIVDPTAKVEPDAGEQDTGGELSTLSVAVTVYVTTGDELTIVAGRWRTGPRVSVTSTSN